MIWTAWNNGRHHQSGAGYGFRVSAADRDTYFDRSWKIVTLELPSREARITVTANIDKPSFWDGTCREMISKEIGQWLIARGLAPWPKGHPPKFSAEAAGTARFVVSELDRS